MRRAVLAPAALLALSVVAGCGSSSDDAGDATASDPSDSPSSPSSSVPTAIPAAPGEVTTGYAVTVIQKGDGQVHACLGYVAQSLPPQCSGPEVQDWDWSTYQRGDYQEVGGTRFGEFAITGTWDGTTLAPTDIVVDRKAEGWTRPSGPGAPRSSVSSDDLKAAARGAEQLPGVAVADVRGGRVHVDVTYDDGTLQAWCDQEYGDGVVVVTPELYDVG